MLCQCQYCALPSPTEQSIQTNTSSQGAALTTDFLSLLSCSTGETHHVRGRVRGQGQAGREEETLGQQDPSHGDHWRQRGVMTAWTLTTDCSRSGPRPAVLHHPALPSLHWHTTQYSPLAHHAIFTTVTPHNIHHCHPTLILTY